MNPDLYETIREIIILYPIPVLSICSFIWGLSCWLIIDTCVMSWSSRQEYKVIYRRPHTRLPERPAMWNVTTTKTCRVPKEQPDPIRSDKL